MSISSFVDTIIVSTLAPTIRSAPHAVQVVATGGLRQFQAASAIDTCAVCNILSSPRLTAAVRARHVWFVVAGYVRYETLVRSRTNPTEAELAIQREFQDRLDRRQGFSDEPLSLADLQAVANLPEVRRLGRGEIASMALARKMRIGFTTDDQKARRSAYGLGIEPVQTTPHLLGWLVFCGELTDGDVRTVICEHETRVSANRGRLSAFFDSTYNEACRCRLLRDAHVAGSMSGTAAK